MQPALANIFQPLINVFEALLRFFHDDIGLGWGLAIVALTVLIRSLLLPLTLKQLRSMYRMAQFTPEIKKLRDKHGSDPRRLQRETMAFYKENRINPLGSVLPAVAQLPVFLSVYFMLRTDLRHDICPAINPSRHAEPAAVWRVGGVALPLHPGPDQSRHGRRSRRADRALRRLATLLVPALGEPDDGQDATDDLHRAALLLHRDRLAAAGGLLVYWITTNTWTIVQGAIVRKRLGHLRQATQDAQAAAVGRGGLADLFKQLRGEDRPAPPPSGRRPRTSGDSTTDIPTGSGEHRSKAGSRPAGQQRRASGPPPAPRRHKKKRSGRRR